MCYDVIATFLAALGSSMDYASVAGRLYNHFQWFKKTEVFRYDNTLPDFLPTPSDKITIERLAKRESEGTFKIFK